MGALSDLGEEELGELLAELPPVAPACVERALAIAGVRHEPAREAELRAAPQD